jgi:tRNA nucleotidyltransferase/poly(A) polymerase
MMLFNKWLLETNVPSGFEKIKAPADIRQEYGVEEVWSCPLMPVPEGIVKLYQAFKKRHKKLLIAGGGVRDHILGQKPKDYDCATDATPDQVIKILDQEGIKRTEQVGEQFGIVIAKIDGEDYEIATFRKDLEAGRQTQVGYIQSPKEDAQRRDLTMNAMFYEIGKHVIIDYIGGVEDTLNRQVVPVGDPSQRFGEDPLRVLRLLRFHSRFNKSEEGISDEVAKSIQQFVDNGLTDKQGKSVPPERIRDEFRKGLKSAQIPVSYLKLYDKFGILRKFVLPGFDKYNTNFINSRDANVVIASILKNNKVNSAFLSKLKAALPMNKEYEAVLYYLNARYANRSSGLPRKLRSDPDFLSALLKSKPNITDEELEQYARWFHVPLEQIKKLRGYQYRSKVTEVPGASEKKGTEIGKHIKQYNTDQALRSLGFKEWLKLY